MATLSAPTNLETARKDFYGRLAPEALAPLRKVLAALVTPTPRSPAVAAAWSFGRNRPLLMEAGELITAAEADAGVTRSSKMVRAAGIEPALLSEPDFESLLSHTCKWIND